MGTQQQINVVSLNLFSKRSLQHARFEVLKDVLMIRQSLVTPSSGSDSRHGVTYQKITNFQNINSFHFVHL